MKHIAPRSCLAALILAQAAAALFADAPAAGDTSQPTSAPACTAPASAATSPAPAHAATTAAAGTANAPVDVLAVTQHRITVRGATFDYTATVGSLPIQDAAGKARAHIFFTAYVRKDADPSGRPITFAFNGGPGAASLWLHLGALGPRRIVMPDDGKTLPKKLELVENDFTWLEFTDLVFLDPVGTGFSRAAAGVDAKEFYSVKGDAHSVGDAIRLYVSHTGRWPSPKFIAGESYGTTRAALLADYLQHRYAMDLTGLMMVSSAIDFQTIQFTGTNVLPYVLYLPSFTAVAWYHHKLEPDLQKDLSASLAEAQKWAADEYSAALSRGDGLPAPDRAKIAKSLARYTGVQAAYFEQNNLRLTNREFAKELLRGEQKVLGTLDARVTGFAKSTSASSAEYDPSLFTVSGPFVATILAYLRDELHYSNDMPYEFLSSSASGSWDWGSAGGGYVDATDELRDAMIENANLRVFAAAGYFDLATGYFAQQYMYSHLLLPDPLRGNLKFVAYPGGHQIYTHLPSLEALTRDVREFIHSGK